MINTVVIEVVELYRFYHVGDEEIFALRGVSLSVRSSEIVALMGPSGSGKSTLLSCIAGIDEPDGGCVSVAGRRMTRKSALARTVIRGSVMGVMPQAGGLFGQLTVMENLVARTWLAGRKDRTKAQELAAKVGLSDRLDSLPSQLSGGETARAALAMALVAGPSVLLADEPTGEVDAATEKRIVELLEEYRDGGGSAIVATHSESLAAYCDRTIRLRDGRIVYGY